MKNDFILLLTFLILLHFVKKSNNHVLNSFYETLEEKAKLTYADPLFRPRSFRSLVYNSVTEIFHLSAVDRLYTLSGTNLTENIIYPLLDLHNPCINNGVKCTHNYIQLVLVKDNVLFICDSSNSGSCYLLNEDKHQNKLESNVVSLNHSLKSVGLISGNKVFIATSFHNAPDGTKPFLVLELNNDNSKRSSFSFEVNSTKLPTTINFKGTFQHEGAVYFVSQRNEDVFLSRMCLNNYAQTFVEMKLSCSLANVAYNILRQIKFVQQDVVEESEDGDHMRNMNDFIKEDLYAVFYNHKSNLSVLCVYSMRDIRNTIVTVVNMGDANNQRLFVKKNVKSPPPTTIDNTTTNYCKGFPLSPITNNVEKVQPILVRSLGPHDVTSLSLKYDEDDVNMMIVSYGTSLGRVFKMSLNNFGENLEPVQLDVENQSDPIIDLISIMKEDLYVLTHRQLMRVRSLNCADMKNIEECLVDPLCGYCTLEKTCTSSLFQCKSTKNIYVKNLVNVNVSPMMVDNNNILQSTFKINSSTPITMSSLKCILLHWNSMNVSEVDALMSPDRRTITCQSFPSFHQPADDFVDGNQKKNKNMHVMSEVQTFKEKYLLMLKNDETKTFLWTGGQVEGVVCEGAYNCTECLKDTNSLCHWCPSEHRCQPLRNTACPITTLTKDIRQCPMISDVKLGTIIHFHSNFHHNITITVQNIQNQPQMNELFCEVDGSISPSSPSSPSSSPTTFSANQIKCNNLWLAYNSDDQEVNQYIRLYRIFSGVKRYIDGSYMIQVYKCAKIASSCGKCKHYLSNKYDCDWCNGACVHESLCPSNLNCDPPAITSISPLGGPLPGKTKLTIIGSNFIFTPSQIQVKVNSVSCTNPFINDTKEQIECVMGGSGSSQPSGPVDIFYNKMKYSSAQKYEFKNPDVKSINPSMVVRSGGSLLTLMGSHLNYGAAVRLYDADSKKTIADHIVSRNDSSIVFRTNPTLRTTITKWQVDGTFFNLNSELTVIEDFVVRRVEKCQSLLEGGTLTIFKFADLFADKAELIVHLSDGTNKTSLCYINNKSLECPTPSLINTPINNDVTLDFGLLIGNITGLVNLCKYSESGFPLKRMKYYKAPTIHPMLEPYHLYPGDKKHHYFDLLSSNNAHLKLFSSDMIMKIGSLEVRTNETLKFELPKYEVLVTDDDVNSKMVDMVLHIGNFKSPVGKILLKSKMDLTLLIGIIVGLALLFLSIIFISFFIFKCYKLHHKHHTYQSTTTTTTTTNNNSELTSLREASNRHDSKVSKNPYSTTPGAPAAASSSDDIDDDAYLDNLLKSMDCAFDSDLFIERDRLKLGDLIGRGNFGSVYVAKLQSKDQNTEATVAVKTIEDPEMNVRAAESFIREGLMMKRFDHPHVLSLHGICLGFKKEPMVILPYMPNGDLKSYVKEPNRQFTARELLGLVHQVSEGMAYLASINFIHRDLAARNCMIDEKKQVKVADFGLSHELHEKNYYSTKDKKAKLPIKWMALESLESFVFTLKSDVWSFGVLMWEVMTRGVTPYPDVEIFEIRDYLASGRRLRRPKFCPENVYNIMLMCWDENPSMRPSFVDLVHEIEITLNPPKRSNSPEPDYLNQDDTRRKPNSHYLEAADA